jgi:hypothetical protein
LRVRTLAPGKAEERHGLRLAVFANLDIGGA